MSRKGRRAERVRELLDAGDHAGARREARAALADESLAEADRRALSAALASIAPDPGAAVAGAIGLAIAAVVAALTVAAG